MQPPLSRTLVFGASGYVGSHLVPFLAARGHAVRAASRRLDAMEARGWPGVELHEADALQPRTLGPVLEGVETAFYLVHSMAAGKDFPALDRRAATNFREAAAAAGVRRIVYLGGLQPPGAKSAHLVSRGETGELLRQGPVPVTELRAGVIIGPGSAAFEIIRDCVFHLPAMVTPRWVHSRSQPVALGDVLEDLLALAQHPEAAGRVYDTGGPEVLSYKQLMEQFGALVGKRPIIVPLPVLTPRLSSYWLDLVTAVPANVARALIEGLSHDVLADDAALRALVPRRLTPFREAAQAAFAAEQANWNEAEGLAPPPGAEPPKGGGRRWAEGSMLYRRNRPDFAYYAKQMGSQADANAPAAALWRVVEGIGGANGYYFLDALWTLRALLDELIGGTGFQRGRRDPATLRLGDAVDFWRVAAIEPGRRLTLLAEMKVPGSAALSFEVQPRGDASSRIVVTAAFHPAGVKGLLYWHALAPVHAFIFPGLVQAIVRRAEAQQPAP